uniref:Uncharacterized protein n=1 Tax=Gasterosteus aculeatus aculeatus TaxID=481459 RepID=A0AAQ4QT01_GASAC
MFIQPSPIWISSWITEVNRKHCWRVQRLPERTVLMSGGEKRPHVGTMSSDVCISPLLYPIRFQLTGKIMTQSAFVSSVRSCAGNNSQTFLQPPGTRLCNPSLHTSVCRTPWFVFAVRAPLVPLA